MKPYIITLLTITIYSCGYGQQKDSIFILPSDTLYLADSLYQTEWSVSNDSNYTAMLIDSKNDTTYFVYGDSLTSIKQLFNSWSVTQNALTKSNKAIEVWYNLYIKTRALLPKNKK